MKFGNFYLFLAIFFLIVFIPFAFFLKWAHTPIHHLKDDVVYYVEEGKSIHEVAHALRQHEVLVHPELFKIYTKLVGSEKQMKFGTFVFTHQNTPAQILSKLVEGDSIKLKLTIPEGLNIYQVSNRLSNFFPQYEKDIWLKFMFDKELISLLPVDENLPKSLEGFLFPDTYFFDPNEKPEHVIKSFISHFKQMIPEELLVQAKEMNLTPFQLVTLASIVQKESAVQEEMNEIATVFFNRLKIKMKLQSDPTVIYGIWDQYKGRITKKHLRARNQYNTYTRYGLPVGPIANPGLQSLQAVLNPAESSALYFVATGNGTHTFSSSYRVHKQAVRKYIKHLRSHARQSSS